MNRGVLAGLAAGLLLAGSSGFLAAGALGRARADVRTTTISVATGPRGPAGPPGPAGPSGPRGEQGPAGMVCPANFAPAVVVVNHPNGQLSLYACVKD